MSASRDNLKPDYWAIIDANYSRAEQLAASLWADALEECYRMSRDRRDEWSRKVD